jgi:hypothetical protein
VQGDPLQTSITVPEARNSTIWRMASGSDRGSPWGSSPYQVSQWMSSLAGTRLAFLKSVPSV